MICLFLFFYFSEQNLLYEIDKDKAGFYRIFTDIDNFISAKFYENGDSTRVVISRVAKGDTIDSVVNIEKSVYSTLKFYCQNFYEIISDIEFREFFVKNYNVAWPIVTEKEIKTVGESTLEKSCLNSFCCIMGTSATGAYIGALTGRDVYKIQGGIPCGHPEYGYCIIPYEYYAYRIDPTHYLTGMALGIATGSIISKKLYYKRNKEITLFNALSHDIVAFDDEGNPITIKEIQKENKGIYTCEFGTLGIVAGTAGSLLVLGVLTSPWFSLLPETEWDEYAVYIPIIAISGVSFWQITKFALQKGVELDHLATIEKIKKKRAAQGHKSNKNE
ncbi:MAG: hypothetical protein ACUVTF_00805 [bacterium]